MKYFGDDGKIYTLTDKLEEDAISCIYKVQGQDKNIAKIYNGKNNVQYLIKTQLLHGIPKNDKIRKYISIPEILLYYDKEYTLQAGFIMEKFNSVYTINDICDNKCPISIKAKAVIAKIFCDMVESIHNHKDIVLENLSHGLINYDKVKITEIILANFNKNDMYIGIINNENFDIKIINTDCLQLEFSLYSNGNKIFNKISCNEILSDIIMPEIVHLFHIYNGYTLKDMNSKGIDTFTKYTDYYCLALYIHILLLDTYPFSNNLDNQNTILPTSNISQHQYVYLSCSPPSSEYIPDFNIITPELQNLFIRAFVDGFSEPTKRPTPREFKDALENYIRGLKPCKCGNPRHYGYKRRYIKKNCEWCKIEKEKKVNYADLNFIFDYDDKIMIIF